MFAPTWARRDAGTGNPRGIARTREARQCFPPSRIHEPSGWHAGAARDNAPQLLRRGTRQPDAARAGGSGGCHARPGAATAARSIVGGGAVGAGSGVVYEGLLLD